MARMARRTQANECRQCSTFCDRVIKPSSCIASNCPALYHYDDPAPTSEWLPAFAAALGAPPPRHMPALPVKLLGGRPLVDWQESLEGASNARARSLGWAPRHGSWRTAFRDP